MAEQLHMVWPESRLESPPEVVLPEEYALRTFLDDDMPAYLALMRSAGFEGWTPASTREKMRPVLPEGFFIVVERFSGALVATAMAVNNPTPLHPGGGELGWVATAPAHRGKRLGLAVCAAVVGRFLQAGYEHIYLRTDDWRQAAIKTYLRLGFEPFLFNAEMIKRWRCVCRKIGRPYTPERWLDADIFPPAERDPS